METERVSISLYKLADFLSVVSYFFGLDLAYFSEQAEMLKTICYLLGCSSQTKPYIELLHKASISQTTESCPARDERTQGFGTTPLGHLLLEQNTC